MSRDLLGERSAVPKTRRRKLIPTQYKGDWSRAAKSIPKSDIKQGPDQVFLLKQTKHGAVVAFRSLEVNPDEPIKPQVEAWAVENNFDIAKHNERLPASTPWAAMTTVRDKSEPWAACAALRQWA